MKRDRDMEDNTEPLKKQNLSETIFRQEEKKYKRIHKKKPYKDDLSNFVDIIDFRNFDKITKENKDILKQSKLNNGKDIYTCNKIPGLFILPQYLSNEEQDYWISEALNKYTCAPPFMNNLVNLNKDTVTEKYSKDIRWSRLGHSYDWSSTTYNNKFTTVFPENLSNYIKDIVKEIDKFDKVKDKVKYDGFTPEACFVNYYLVGNTMMAHQDKSELTYDRPLVSMSLGCSGLFLIGTDDRNDKPYAFLLRSGDVICMTGDSRLAFHGVPRILNDCPEYLKLKYAEIDGLRININARQVFD